MKKKIIFIVALMLGLNTLIHGQAVFSVKPGLNLNGASFGIQVKKFQPFIGIRFANLKVESESHDDNYPQDDYISETRINVYMPYMGAKLFFTGTDAVKPYLQASFFKPLVFGKQKEDGDEDEEFKQNLNNIGVWAGEVGFGSEYFFHPQFSIGGEFGMRLGNFKMKYESDNGDYWSSDKISMSVSYVAFSLNYYFGKD